MIPQKLSFDKKICFFNRDKIMSSAKCAVFQISQPLFMAFVMNLVKL